MLTGGVKRWTTEPVFIELMGRHTVEDGARRRGYRRANYPRKTDLYVDCRQKRLRPNSAHPDQPVLQVK